MDPEKSSKWRRVSRGKPPLGWERPFAECFGTSWIETLAQTAVQGTTVLSLRPDFVQQAYACLRMPMPVAVKAIHKSCHAPEFKQQRIVKTFETPSTNNSEAKCKVCLVGDNETVEDWWNGDNAVSALFRHIASSVWGTLMDLWKRDKCHAPVFKPIPCTRRESTTQNRTGLRHARFASSAPGVDIIFCRFQCTTFRLFVATLMAGGGRGEGGGLHCRSCGQGRK